MTQIIGPFDGRTARRKRCDRCVERRIKCVGGFPCLNCSKTNRVCRTTAKPKSAAPVFVHATQATFTTTGSPQETVLTPPLISQVPSSIRNDTYLTYFFTSFLSQNTFKGIAPHFDSSLLPFLHSSSELQDAINAISAYHITQDRQSVAPKCDVIAALKAYSRSVSRVQLKIASNAFVCDPSALWTTLLLGVFELMRDNTGTNWLAHFLHGTGTMLRTQGPSILTHSDETNKHRQEFFFTARIFEIVRALIFTEPTFLSEPDWRMAIEMYWIDHVDAWTPKEALFDMLPQFVDLGIRALNYASEGHGTAQQLADEGLALQSVLLHWHTGYTSWTSYNTMANEMDLETIITGLYYHTVSIYLDGIFSYHMPFVSVTSPPTPTLDRTVVDEHVKQILMLSHKLLAQGSAGILLFFPLRVAGARARSPSTRYEIQELLQIITQRGFSVAQSFLDDLSELWAQQ